MFREYGVVFTNPKFLTGVVIAIIVACLLIFLPRIFRKLKGNNKVQSDDEAEEAQEEQIYVGGPIASSPTANNSSLIAAKGEKGYLTNVFRIRHGRTELVELRLKEPLGSGMDREPAVPFKGRYFAIEKTDKDGNTIYVPYDPREEPVLSNYTPQDCYDATHWDEEVDGVYANSSDWQEKVGLVIIGIAIFLNFIVALVALGKLK